MYITRLLRTLKSLGVTLSVTFDDGRSGDADGVVRVYPAEGAVCGGERFLRRVRARGASARAAHPTPRHQQPDGPVRDAPRVRQFDRRRGNDRRPAGRAHSTHILKPKLEGRPDGLAREHYGHALAAELGLAHYRTELVGSGARQYLVIERYDRAVDGETVTLIHQEDAAQALGLDWVDDHAKFQDPQAPPDSRRPSAYRIAEFLGSLQGEGRPVADFLRRLTFMVLLGDDDAHAKNFAKALDHVPVPRGVPAAAAAQLAWNVERLQSGGEICERPSEYRRRRSRL